MKEEKQEGPPETGAPKVEGFEEIEKEVKKPKPKKKLKRRPGRPTLDEQKAKEVGEKAEIDALLAADTGAIQGMLEWIFGALLAPRFGPHWKLKPAEAEAGGQAWAPLLAKYSPAFNKWIEEIRAGTWTIGTVGPRWEETKRIMAAMAAKEAAQAKPSPAAESGSGNGLTKTQKDHNIKAGAG